MFYRSSETTVVKPVAYNYGPIGHIQIAHHAWTSVVKKGDIVVDATCGNGNDSLFLARLALDNNNGLLYCIDIQKDAINNTMTKLKESKELECIDHNQQRINFICDSHETFPNELLDNTVSLICYNLGYLPGKTRIYSDNGNNNKFLFYNFIIM